MAKWRRRADRTSDNARARLAVAICALAVCAAGCAGHKPAGTRAHEAPLDRAVFSAVDCESTGLNSKTDRIVEIGVVKFRGTRRIGSRSWLVNPGIPIPQSAVSIHGITTDMVRNSPDFAKVFPQFKEYVGETVILAHNARFDLAFFNAEIKRAGLAGGRNRIIDTLPVFRIWFPRATRHTLEYMIQYLEFESEDFHRGLSDAESLFEVFRAGVKTQPLTLTVEDLIRTAGGEMSFGAKDQVEMP